MTLKNLSSTSELRGSLMSDLITGCVTVEEELEKFGSYASITRGTSMAPLFKTHRDVVVIEPINAELKKYDVVLYRNQQDQYVLHRIIKVKGDNLIIRGDNNFYIEYLRKSDIVGVLTQFNRKGKAYTVKSFGYLFYSRFWHIIYPLRYLKMKGKRLLAKVYRKIIGKGKKG